MDRTRVRLHRVDAPERGQPYGPIATAALEYMVARSVYLVKVDEDRYGRLTGKLFQSKEGYDINASMVCAGYEWWYERYAPDSQNLYVLPGRGTASAAGIVGGRRSHAAVGVASQMIAINHY